MDALSAMLEILRLTSTLHWRTALHAPWGLRMDATADMVFHIVEQGDCWLHARGMAEPLWLLAGDLVVLPHGPQHELTDELDTAATFITQVQFSTEKGCKVIANMGMGQASTILCGVFQFERGIGPLLVELLPAFIYIPAKPDDSWLTNTLHLLGQAASEEGPGASLLQSRLADILFVQVLRRWLAQQETAPSWLNALRDPAISAALSHIHRAPTQPWTVAELARESGLSRSAFAACFKRLVGQTPMRYLMNWRIAQAAHALRHTPTPIVDLAVQAGYATTAAFSKAFKQTMNMSPQSYRRLHRAAPTLTP